MANWNVLRKVTLLLMHVSGALAAEAVSNLMSPIVSYRFPEGVGSVVLPNGGIESPIASFQYLENFTAAELTSGELLAPFVSYQYYEWPGNTLLRMTSSPQVSFYFDPVGITTVSLRPSAGSVAATVVAIDVPTKLGETYAIESKNSLTDSVWNWVLTIFGDGQLQTFIDNLSERSRFYRIRSLSSGFLSFPIHGKTPFTAEISAVMDHSGTPLDTLNPGKWYKAGLDHVVEAFTHQAGQDRFGISCSPSDQHPGYKNADDEDFLKDVVNYVGTKCSSQSSEDEVNQHPKRYLNYDGHSGYDYPYPGMTVLAPADGRLLHATTDSANGPTGGQTTAWESYHTFYIDHGNGYTTWYLHCASLVAEVENIVDNAGFADVKRGDPIAIVGDYCVGCKVSGHLHFEVRKGLHTVLDPYTEGFWSLTSQ